MKNEIRLSLFTIAFHSLANEGKDITKIRNEYKKTSINIPADRAELIIKLRGLKKIFFNK